MEKFLISSAVMLIAVTIVTIILMNILFKNSIYKKISLLWVITMVLNSINTNARNTFEDYPQSIALPVGIIVIGLGIAYASRYFSGPIKELINSVQSISKGKLSIKLSEKYLNRNDEIGKLAGSIENLTETFQNMIFQIKESSRNLNTAGNKLQSITSQLIDSSSVQAEKVSEISEALLTLTNEIKQNAMHSETAKTSLSESQKAVMKGNNTTSMSIKSLRDVIIKIDVINDIAFKTNLLSLNASIEASKASSAGKGFSVVASEIKKLSQKSHKAAEDIANVSSKVITMAERADEELKTIIKKTQETSQVIKKITSSIIEQKSEAETVDNSIREIKNLSYSNKNISDDISVLSKDIKDNSEKLSQILKMFTESSN